MVMGSRVRRAVPWVTPTLVAVEIGLVAAGVLRPAHAVVVFVVIELAIAVAGIGSVIAATRTYRRSAREVSRRDAASAALESVLPRRLAQAVIVEAQAWRAFALWLRRRRPEQGEFTYGNGLRPLLYMVIGLLVIEGVAVELVVAMVFGHGWWLWVVAALHLYALCWIVGIAASLRTMPHHIGMSEMTLRDSIFDEYRLPLRVITGVRAVTTVNTGRSGLRVDASGNGRLCHGDGTITLTFADATMIREMRVRELAVSIDRPAEFADACRAAIPTIPREPR